MKLRMLTLCCAVVLWAVPVLATTPDAILGQWKTANDKAVVNITRCDGGKFCGTIVSLKEPLYTDPKAGPVGTPKTDRKNPDPSLRARPIIGLRFMQGFAFTQKCTWEDGTIYDPERGKTYRGKMKLVAPDRLELRGFLGVSLLGRSEVWTR